MVNQLKESWNSRLGVILAVSGSAVGLGNFLRFPGQVAQYGGGAFMVAYFISFLLIGLPICWAEWTMGRYGGQRGFHSAVGVLYCFSKKPAGKYLGIIGIVIPVIIYMYYVLIEAWCLGYAFNFLMGNMQFADVSEAGAFFAKFAGANADGVGMGFGGERVGFFLLFCFALNFFLIYRGVAKGIELFCRYAMPALILLAVVVLVRVLTLPASGDDPQKTISAGLGFMWNPDKVELVQTQLDAAGQPVLNEAGVPVETATPIFGKEYIAEMEAQAAADPAISIRRTGLFEQMLNPSLWLAAAGQIFFSLSVGFGVIVTYASYLKHDDDIVLSGLAATSANEFCEVALGGLLTIPASVAFLGAAGLGGLLSTFALGFNVLPMVFSAMPLGNFFGAAFFFLLFLAAVTSSLSMLQPGIAFLETSLGINRKASVAILGLITSFGTGFAVYFSKDLKALDTLDFWAGTFLIYVLAMVQIIIFAWVFGAEKGLKEAQVGSILRLPPIVAFVMRYVTPLFLLLVFLIWLVESIFGFSIVEWAAKAPAAYVTDLFPPEGGTVNLVAWMAVGVIALFALFVLILANSSRYFRRLDHSDTDHFNPENRS
ncbi:MAG: sodium:calcium symporter [Opitutales bacterium]